MPPPEAIWSERVGARHRSKTLRASDLFAIFLDRRHFTREMTMKINKIGVGFAVVAALGLALGTASPASALGSASGSCSSVASVQGNSSATGSAQTWTQWSAACGELGVLIFYTIYPGSPTYYTSWSYGQTSVYKTNPGNSVHGANHLAKRGSSSDVNFTS